MPSDENRIVLFLQNPKRKNPAAVALGELGGKKGGKARAETLTVEQQKEFARNAAKLALIEGLRLATAPQPFRIITYGFAPYKTAIPDTLGDRCDYAMLIKVYRATPEGERKYSPAEVVDTEVVPVGAIPILAVFARLLWSARTSQWGCKCRDSHA
jgi:hypothetical protein